MKNNWWDVDAVRSLEGVYLANILTTWEHYGPHPVREEDVTLKTKITFDGGDHWRPLLPPSVDSQGNKITCSGACSLNLFGRSTWVPSDM
jgi:hypothetical protein